VRIPGPKFWIAACSLAAVLVAAVIETDRASPGPISSVHARVRDLKQGASCSACHGGWFSDMTHSCERCHAPIAKEIEEKRGLHGTLEKALAQNCASCHGEHHGETFQVVNAKSFSFAGVPDRDAFDHLKIGYELNGRHFEIRCAECHENADKDVLAEGEKRFLGLDRACQSCHEDPHQGRMRVDCVACHGQTTWQDLHSFGHEKRLPLVGGHGDVACRTCHAESDAHALEILGESAHPPAARECADCHVSPHAAAFTRGAAELAAKTPGAGCVECHLAGHTDFGEASTSTTPAQHALSGFALEVPHADVACKACHAPDLVGFRARYPGRSSAACSACHTDVHGGQFAKGPFAHQECTACHDQERFEPHAFTVEKHAVTRAAPDGEARRDGLRRLPLEAVREGAAHLPRLADALRALPQGRARRRVRRDGHGDPHGAARHVRRLPRDDRVRGPPAERLRPRALDGLRDPRRARRGGVRRLPRREPEPRRRRPEVRQGRAALRPLRGLRDVPRGRPPGRLRQTGAPRGGRGPDGLRALPRGDLLPLAPARLRARSLDRLRARRGARGRGLLRLPRAFARRRRRRADLDRSRRIGLPRLPRRSARRPVRGEDLE
jgi:hypothetical protein